MKYIDIHAHLETPRFKEDLDNVIQRCQEKDCAVINAGVNPGTNKKCLELKNKYPETIKISFGLYPIDALAREIESSESKDFLKHTEPFNVDEEIKWIEKNKDECVAIGEIGLDYNWDEIKKSEELKDKQKRVFQKIISLSKKIQKPIIIHSRKAEQDAIEILEKEIPNNEVPVIMHCFNGKKSLIKRCVENGWYFSVPPIITRLEHFKMLVQGTPIEQLLTETDSPYLSPNPGERNEPINVQTTIEEIAKIKNLDVEEVREIILENSERVFGGIDE